MTALASSNDAPVAVICGGGTLPAEVVEAARATGREVLAIAIKGEAAAALERFEPISLGWGQIGKLFDTMKKAGCHDVVLIGGVTRRPDFRSVAGDLGTLRRLPRIIAALTGGDDSLLVKVIGIFEDEGFRVIGAHEIAPSLLAGPGAIVGPEPAGEAVADMQLARQAVEALGRLDIGQAAVALGGRVIAVEGAEGTDAMLERCAELRRIGRVNAKGRIGVLVKRAKPGQDLRADLPTIGPKTIEAAAQAGLAGIALEAGRVFIAERDATLAAARDKGLFLHGFKGELDGA
ncbi:UDP-2,3-diacylglucosamine diphosphatase LpxI [Stappia sp. F7233]|uniref:UDP-2,3-diacylglucosamine diphosphatase LpxI n=1 Tax=Stappia albiluteola TaxID=2758565 RepID=A0A839AAD2_9HYPH|nr:UDP-2,3-diacylglucosamine diphosphatase LpxI [Stappia albiluteola]MBA5776533.1 UDP-2,3-diacylglucosamine diphosphatase LpxI [Stappia albiluteola]